MSQLIVEVCRIDSVLPHHNAEKLDLALIKGWQTVIGKGSFKAGDLVVYIPINAIVPPEISDKYNFTKYLSNGRVKAARLRGEPSYGVLIPNDWKFAEGEEVSEKLGIKKWTPEVRACGSSGPGKTDEEPQHPLFPKYTELENLRHYPAAFADGEEVVLTEKIHGSNSRIGIIDGQPFAGSRNRRLKLPTTDAPETWLGRLFRFVTRRPKPTITDFEKMKDNWWWMPWTLPNVAALLTQLGQQHKQVVLYGEVYGANVQKGVRYGSPDKVSFRAFDLLIDGKYLNYGKFKSTCDTYSVPTVPLLYRGPYSLTKVKEFSQGKTMVGEGETHIREGVVVRPVIERHDPKLGRVAMKYVSDDYLTAKDIGDFEDE
jgi:RNA ligase (TIGR02306 family)